MTKKGLCDGRHVLAVAALGRLMRVPKKARKALRRLGKMPAAKSRREHVHRIARATQRYLPPIHPRSLWRGLW